MKIGKVIGYWGMFFVFSAVLYFLLKITEKLPETWSYLSVLGISAGILIVGNLIKRWLK